jgi:integrase
LSNTLQLWVRPDSQYIWLRGTVGGRPYAKSTGTADLKQAREVLAQRQAELFREAVYGKKAVATFAEAVAAFLKEAPRSERDKKRIGKLLDHFGTTPLKDIGQHSLADAYAACLEPGAGPGGRVRGVVAPLRAILRNAALHGLCEPPMLKAPKVPRAPTHYLKPAEVARLVAAAPDHAKPLFVFLFGVGPRASEAIDLEWDGEETYVDLRGARARLKQKQEMARPYRDADLPPVVLAALRSLPHRQGAVFRPDKRGERAPPEGEWQGYKRNRGSGGKSEGTGGQFKKLWATACRNAGLPGKWRTWTDKKGRAQRQWVPAHSPHDARHTWATWHYCIHRDLLGLRDAGGWTTTQMVERYAKVMPDAYRAEAEAWLAGRPIEIAAKRRKPR